MSNDAKLQKVILGPDWIDLSFGEPKLIMEAMFEEINKVGSSFKMPDKYDIKSWEYQPASGNPQFVELLQSKYRAKVVVCNGAKQALAASLYAFKKNGAESVYYDIPYYPANPSIVDSVGLKREEFDTASLALITSPNNPDGKNYSNYELLNIQRQKPMIHDGAYYTPAYLPDGQDVINVGDVQIFSFSKTYGVSGLRIGYAVCHTEQYYKDIVDFMETTTAGVSTASQSIAMEIEKYFIDNPMSMYSFYEKARMRIHRNRNLFSSLNPEVLELIPCETNSMFAWCKAGPKLDNKAAKVHILDGSLFGKPGMMRINIAQPTEMIVQAIERLNKYTK